MKTRVFAASQRGGPASGGGFDATAAAVAEWVGAAVPEEEGDAETPTEAELTPAGDSDLPQPDAKASVAMRSTRYRMIEDYPEASEFAHPLARARERSDGTRGGRVGA